MIGNYLRNHKTVVFVALFSLLFMFFVKSGFLSSTLRQIFATGQPFLISGTMLTYISLPHLSSMAGKEVSPYSMVFVTAPNQEVAKKLAGGLVSGKMAACVNLVPSITSVYEWEGKIENDEEVLMMIKTKTERITDLTEYVKSNHPYDVAEVISTSIEQGNTEYLDWIGRVVAPKKS